MDSDGELTLVWAEHLVLCERRLHSVLCPDPARLPPARLSAASRERSSSSSSPAPAPAPHPLVGKNSSAAGVSARPGIWLPRAGIERLQPPSLPPSRQGLLEDTRLCSPCPAGLWAGLCAGGSANPGSGVTAFPTSINP